MISPNPFSRRHTSAALGMAWILSLSASHLSAQTTLFADTFDRVNDTDLNASATGKSGAASTANWVGTPVNGTVDINSNVLRIDSSGTSGNEGGFAWVDCNFVGLTEFTVSVDLEEMTSGGDGRNAGFSIGQSRNDLATLNSATVSAFAGDVGVYIDAVGGTQGVNITHGGSSVNYLSAVTVTPPKTLSATFTFTDMNSGTTLDYEVFVDAVSVATGSTTWSGTSENYIALTSNTTGDTRFDDFSVVGTTAAAAPALLATDPDDLGVMVEQDYSPVLSFDQFISTVSGNVELWKVGTPDTLVESFDVATSGQLSIEFNTLTIDPASDLERGESYYVLIDSTALENAFDGSFDYPGLSSTSEWTFTVHPADFEVDAGLDDGTNDIWEASPGTEGSNLEFALDSTVIWNAITSPTTALTHAYDFPGGSVGSGDEAGIDGGKLSRIDEGPGECYSFQDGPTPAGWDVQDVTMEIWLRPDNLTPPDGGYTIFEDGGGTGLGLFITNNELIVSQDTDDAIISYNLDTDTSGLLNKIAEADFIQCVVTRQAAGATEMFINGTSVGTSDDTDGDWTGGDGFGLGTRGEANTGGRGSGDGTGADGTTRSFDGEIALFRVYNNNILSPTEIQANYDALVAADTSAPGIIALSPADDAPSVAPTTDLVATFDENLVLGTGDIRIVNDTDTATTTIAVTDGTQVTVAGNILTISPTTPLLGNKNYHIEIDAGALEDAAGNGIAGILDSTTWNFTTDGVPPTLDTFANNKPGGQIYDNDSIVYTLTFSEDLNVSTIETGDFSNGGSAGITVDSVTSISSTVFEVVVSPTSTGTIQLQVAAPAVIEDLAGNALDTSSPTQDPTIVDVLAFVANSAAFIQDFQQTLSSESYQSVTGDTTYGLDSDIGPGRFFHISVNPNNAGYAAYCGLDPSRNAITPFVRTFSDPVVGWSFVGGGTNGDLTISEESGGIVSWTTTDETDPITNTFDSFGMNQRKFWNANDPGSDISLPANKADVDSTTHNKTITGYRSFGQATATIDVSSLASGTVYIFYGAFSAVPLVDAVLIDSSGLEPDIPLADLHTNGDTANRTEYYVAEVSFDTDGGAYDTIVYNYLQPGTEPDGSGNGRSGGVVITGLEIPTGTAYDTWAAGPFFGTLSDVNPNIDFDNGGLITGIEYVVGGDPTDGSDDASVAPTFANDDPTFFTFTFRISDQASADPNTTAVVEYGSNLTGWTTAVDNDSTIEITTTDGTGPDEGFDIVTVQIDRSLAVGAKLFARLNVTIVMP